MAFHEVDQHQKRNESRQDKYCFYPTCKENLKKNYHKIYYLTKSIYSSVVRNSFSCLTVLLAVVWSPELGLYIFIFGRCVCWFVFLSCWSVSARFGSGRKREGGWLGSKTGKRFGSGRKQEWGLGRVEIWVRVENRRQVVLLCLCPFIADMSSDVMWYIGQSYLVISRGLELVKRLRCRSVFNQNNSFKGVGISGKFDQYFPVTTDEQPPADFKKTRYPHGHCEPDHWPLTHTLLPLKF